MRTAGFALYAAIALSAGDASAAGPDESVPASEASSVGALRLALEAVLVRDQQYRSGEHRWADVAERQQALDRDNLVTVLELVERHGWPRISEVGEDAALAAFLVVQHADLATQQRFLPIVRERVAEGEARGAWLALLTDRILVGQDKPQRYGTQSRLGPDGRSAPWPIEDPEGVNARRVSLGMKPLAGRPVAPTIPVPD